MSSPSMTVPSSASDTLQRRSSVPLLDQSVFVPASPSSSAASPSRRASTTTASATLADNAATDAVDQRPPKPTLSLSLSYDASDIVEASQPSQSPTSAGPPSTPPRTKRATPRRSRAHQPRLLGLDRNAEEENGVGASEDVLLTGLGIHASTPKRPSLHALGKSRSDVTATRTLIREEEQFRIDGDDDDGSDKASDDTRTRAINGDAPHDQEVMYSAHANPFQRPSYENDALLFGDDIGDREGGDGAYRDDDGDDDDLEAQGSAYALPFEPITHQEKLWMWSSVVFVIALSLVSIAIAADWIDWPGDGIGKD